MIKQNGHITITCPSKNFTKKGLFLMVDDDSSHQKIAVEWQELLDIRDLVNLLCGYELSDEQKLVIERLKKIPKNIKVSIG